MEFLQNQIITDEATLEYLKDNNPSGQGVIIKIHNEDFLRIYKNSWYFDDAENNSKYFSIPEHVGFTFGIIFKFNTIKWICGRFMPL
jgi:hypothetical protein